MVEHLSARLGEGVVVRSDDIDGNDVIGTAATSTAVHRFRVTCTDDGEVVSSEISPAGGDDGD